MDLINQLVMAYAEKYSSRQNSLLEELLEETVVHHPQAHMISGKVQGLLLEMISILVKPERILEIGTFTGYSALCLAKGLPPTGFLHTIEIREADAGRAKRYFELSPQKEQIMLHIGDAMKVIPGLHETWDLVFIDADKIAYLDYYKMVLPRVRSGGIILADNVLFHGEVLEEPVKGKNAKAIQAFNKFVKSDESVEKVLLTIRDGLLMIRKK